MRRLPRRADARREFDAFATAQADRLVRAAFLMVGDRGEAEDLAQECLLRVARRWPRVRTMQHPGAYARRVLFNLILDGRNRRTRRLAELGGGRDETGDRQATASEAARPEERLDMVHALAALPPRQRAILVLRYYADLPEEEIAATLGCAPGTVKSGAARALERLRGLIGEPDGRGGGDLTKEGAKPWIRS